MGGMTYQGGCLTVPQSGTYYVYAKIFFMGFGRVTVRVNGKIVNFVQNTENVDDVAQVGGPIILKAGDVICLNVSRWPNISESTTIYLSANYSSFVAFLI